MYMFVIHGCKDPKLYETQVDITSVCVTITSIRSYDSDCKDGNWVQLLRN